MKLATSTGDFYRYCNSYCKSIEYAHAAGFRYLNFDIDKFETFEEQLLSDDWREGIQKIKDCTERLGMKIVQSHAYGNSNLYAPGANREERLQKILRSIEVSGALGVSNMVLHGQVSRDFKTKEQYFEANRSFLSSIRGIIEDNGVNVLIENGPLKHFSEDRFTTEKIENPGVVWGLHNATIMREFLAYAELPFVHTCWDTGHRNMDGTQYDQLMILGEELYALHVHDNRDNNDEHLIPYFGTMSLDDLMHGLIDCGYKGYFTFEAANAIGCESRYLKPRREFPGDQRLLVPPIELKMHMEEFMYKVGVHALKSYDCFEE